MWPTRAGLGFLTDLVKRDELDAFRDCLDDWTLQVFDVRVVHAIPGHARISWRNFSG